MSPGIDDFGSDRAARRSEHGGPALSDVTTRVEEEHEAIERLLDRVGARRPVLDLGAVELLERRLATGLLSAYADLRRAVGPEFRPDLRPLRSRPRRWLQRIRSLRRTPPTSPTWWTRLNDLDHRIRTHFHEVEAELFEAVVEDSGSRSAHFP